MRTTTCFCTAVLSGQDDDELFAAARAHFDAAHAELDLPDQAIRNYLDAEERLTGGTERLDAIGAVEIHPVGPDRVDDYLEFFDHHAFADNAGWAACYCLFHHVDVDQRGWAARPWRQNREEMSERLRQRRTTGLLAYVDGRPAAWCNATRRSEFPHYAKGDGDAETGVTACFVIAAPYRRHGLARRLLDGALDLFRDQGLTSAEGYPRRETQGDAGAYHGPLSLFLAAGFEPVSEADNVITVRRPL